MKRFRHISLLALFIAFAGMFTFSACSDDDHVNSNKDYIVPNYDSLFTIVDTTVYSIDQVADMLYGPDGANADEGQREAFLRRAHAYEDSLADLVGANDEISTEYVKVNFQYYDAEVKGNALSGVAIWRRLADIGYIGGNYTADVEKQLDGLFPHFDKVFVIEQEYVNNDNDRVTLNEKNMFTYLENEMLIYPDRKGYGKSAGQERMHLSADRNATNSRKAIGMAENLYKATMVMSYYDKVAQPGMQYVIPLEKYFSFDENYKVYIAGINEGAAVAMAQHKYFDSNPDEKAKYHFAGSVCYNGIYNPHLTFDKWLKTDSLDDPLLIPIFVKESLTRYPLERVTEDKVYSEKFLSKKTEIEALINNTNLTRKEKNGILKVLLGVDVVKPSDMLSEDFLSKGLTYQYFIANLNKFDVGSGFTPSSPICLIHADNDGVSPLINATMAQKQFKGKAPCTLKTIHYTDEQLSNKAECGMPASAVLDWYENSLWKWDEAYDNAGE